MGSNNDQQIIANREFANKRQPMCIQGGEIYNGRNHLRKETIR